MPLLLLHITVVVGCTLLAFTLHLRPVRYQASVAVLYVALVTGAAVLLFGIGFTWSPLSAVLKSVAMFLGFLMLCGLVWLTQALLVAHWGVQRAVAASIGLGIGVMLQPVWVIAELALTCLVSGDCV